MNMTLRANNTVYTYEREPCVPFKLVENVNFQKETFENIAVVGLGYVGLPLAVCLAEKFQTVHGVDISKRRVAEIQVGIDATNEISEQQLFDSGLSVSVQMQDMANATFFIVTVPTPITDAKQPDLSPLQSSCEMIAPYLKKGDVVVFESTVYPGVTEDFCGPILADISGLTAGEDFGLAYSPERINPGDKVNTVENVIKIVSGDSAETLARVSAVYNTVIKAGLHEAKSIKVAEAAKVLENTQRDINIALMNEMSLICDKIGVGTKDVIDAAATKWNFVPFTPGLVGGHCIGVDPYYLAALAEKIGHHPQVILAGRRTNDGMVRHVADTVLRRVMKTGKPVDDLRIGLFGITFKENVPDIRNSKSIELISILKSYGMDLMVNDAHCQPETAKLVDIDLLPSKDVDDLDVMVLSTPHKDYIADPTFLDKLKPGGILIDVRGVYRDDPRITGMTYWAL